MPDEEAFCLLVRLMYSYDLRGHFLPEMPKLQLRIVSTTVFSGRLLYLIFLRSFRYCYPSQLRSIHDEQVLQFERLLEEFAPVLHIHFLRQGVKSSMYCSQWFLTMFSYRLVINLC